MGLRETIEALCIERLGREPNLDSPAGYNDLIQWLKLYDQRPEHITACDKWAVRGMVPAANLIPAKPGAVTKWMPCVLKGTHDSGSVAIVEGLHEWLEAKRILKEKLAQPYGVEKGEWAYALIKPRLFTEKLLELNITDYKFHCSHGKIRWVQVIGDRANETRETILSPAGEVLSLHMDQNMRHAPEAAAYPGNKAWGALTELAETLAAGWRYVRVDLYWSQGKAWFGELTFWPLAGAYKTEDEPRFGEMLDLDLSCKFAPIVT